MAKNYSRITLLIVGFLQLHECTPAASYFLTKDSHQEVPIGQSELVLTCHAENYTWANQIIFSKELRDHTTVQVASGFAFQTPFKESERYFVSRTGGEFRFTIKDVRLGDSGTYKCTLYDIEEIAPVLHTVVVVENIEQISLYSDSEEIEGEKREQVFTFQQERSEAYSVNCSVKGGNPKPEVTIQLGSDDITSQFALDVQEIPTLTLDAPGLDEIRYEITLVNDNFRPEVKYDGQKLRCTAKVPDTDFKETARRAVRVIYPPAITCEEEIISHVGETDLQLECHIRANPPIIVNLTKWSWTVDNETVTVMQGARRDKFSTTSLVTEDTGEVTVRLHIGVVNDTDFREYTLSVENNIETKQMDILLKEKNDEVPYKEDPSPEDAPTQRKNIEGASSVTFPSLSVAIATLLIPVLW